MVSANQILTFFKPDSKYKSGNKIIPKSVRDLMATIGDKRQDIPMLINPCKKLSNEGYLVSCGPYPLALINIG